MSQPCSAVELVLFDARDLTDTLTRKNVATVLSLGVLAGAVLNEQRAAEVVEQAGYGDSLGFWFGADGTWPFERALAFTNIEPGRTLFVSSDPAACQAAHAFNLQVADDRTADIATLLP